jgi:aldose 1-epimerase
VSELPVVEFERYGDLLEMHTSRSSITVDPADGGRLTSLTVDGIELLGERVPAPGAPPEIFRGSFLMAPFVGRTAGGEFEFRGERYRLPLNFGSNAMHGFVFDRPWTVTDEGIAIDLDERWPFGGSVTQRFELGESELRITAEIRNETREMPAILGFHPWFRDELDGGGRASFDFVPGTRYVCDDNGIPTHTIPGGGERPWDDSFTDVAQPPTISWEGGPELSIGTTGSHWIVCETMPFAFCIEPLSGPVNGLATGDGATVGPGRPLTHSMTLHWS